MKEKNTIEKHYQVLDLNIYDINPELFFEKFYSEQARILIELIKQNKLEILRKIGNHEKFTFGVIDYILSFEVVDFENKYKLGFLDCINYINSCNAFSNNIDWIKCKGRIFQVKQETVNEFLKDNLQTYKPELRDLNNLYLLVTWLNQHNEGAKLLYNKYLNDARSFDEIKTSIQGKKDTKEGAENYIFTMFQYPYFIDNETFIDIVKLANTVESINYSAFMIQLNILFNKRPDLAEAYKSAIRKGLN
jgi:hypothetical protein